MTRTGVWLFIFCVCTQAFPETINLNGRPVRGVTTSRAQAFRGLRYAQPPTGENRFRPTIIPEPAWNGTYDASQFGAVCPQMQTPLLGGDPVYVGEEDCLYLNVFRPKTATPLSRLPVMVFIHGGGNYRGSGSDPIQEGSNLAATANLIVVTFNYRLGRLGFLSHPSLSARLGFPSGNFAYYDQIAALTWVQNNIGAFGGDPRAVTLFGQSAGGLNVLSLSISPKAGGLFQRAIIESTFAEMKTTTEAETLGQRLIRDVCTGTDRQILNCLLNTPAPDLVSRQSATGFIFQHEYLARSENGPVLDGRLFTRTPLAAASAGLANPSAILIGSNSGDGIIEMLLYENGVETSYSASDFLASLRTAFGSEIANQLSQIYSPSKFRTVGDALMALRTDFDFACSTRQLARALRQASGPSVRRYQFEAHFLGPNQFLIKTLASLAPAQSVSLPFSLPFPAFHGIDVPYEFQNIQVLYEPPTGGRPAPITVEDAGIQSVVGAYWTRFAKTGNPNGPGYANWPEYEAVSDVTQRLDVQATTLNSPQNAGCDVYDSLYPTDAHVGAMRTR